MPPDAVKPPELSKQHPAESVADHEVLMTFNSDSHAEFFRMWWAKLGEKGFLNWANAQKAR